MPKPLKVFPHVGVSVSPVGQQRPQRCSRVFGGVPKTGPLSVFPSQGLSHSVGHVAPIGSHVPTYMGLTRKAGIPRVSPPPKGLT